MRSSGSVGGFWGNGTGAIDGLAHRGRFFGLWPASRTGVQRGAPGRGKVRGDGAPRGSAHRRQVHEVRDLLAIAGRTRADE